MSIPDIGRVIRGSTGRQGMVYPDLEDGMPVDRTICPKCLGLGGEYCDVCEGRAVCPVCRGARVVVMRPEVGSSFTYRACSGCCDELQDVNGRPERSATGYPAVTRRPDRRRETIAAYRRRIAAERQAATKGGDAGESGRDPWNE